MVDWMVGMSAALLVVLWAVMWAQKLAALTAALTAGKWVDCLVFHLADQMEHQ
jgi:hypothetical protein